jgi:hypothetical protein
MNVIHTYSSLQEATLTSCCDDILTSGDISAVAAFHTRGLLDYLIVGDVLSPQEVTDVQQHLKSIGAHNTKILLKVKVRLLPTLCKERDSTASGIGDASDGELLPSAPPTPAGVCK